MLRCNHYEDEPDGRYPLHPRGELACALYRLGFRSEGYTSWPMQRQLHGWGTDDGSEQNELILTVHSDQLTFGAEWFTEDSHEAWMKFQTLCIGPLSLTVSWWKAHRRILHPVQQPPRVG